MNTTTGNPNTYRNYTLDGIKSIQQDTFSTGA
jgi:hypothetical protein